MAGDSFEGSYSTSDQATSGDIRTGDQINSSGGDSGWKIGLVKGLTLIGIAFIGFALLRKKGGK